MAYMDVCHGNGTYIACSLGNGTNVGTMRSADGTTWTSTLEADTTRHWQGIAADGAGRVVRVNSVSAPRAYISTDNGATWANSGGAGDGYVWSGIVFADSKFVTVSNNNNTNQRVMTSPDGAASSWTLRTTPANLIWNEIGYGNGLFVAVAQSGTGNRVMTSPDGITWTSRTSAADNTWEGVAYGNGIWVAVSSDGTGNRVMTSVDGFTWTSRNAAAELAWNDVCFGNGMFVAVASSGTGNRAMASYDGVNWVSMITPQDNTWRAVVYGTGRFVAVSQDGSNQVMTLDY